MANNNSSTSTQATDEVQAPITSVQAGTSNMPVSILIVNLVVANYPNVTQAQVKATLAQKSIKCADQTLHIWFRDTCKTLAILVANGQLLGANGATKKTFSLASVPAK